jgi:hypothetical protein
MRTHESFIASAEAQPDKALFERPGQSDITYGDAREMVYGGLMGTTSGVAGILAATDKRLVPYGAMTASFCTGWVPCLGHRSCTS